MYPAQPASAISTSHSTSAAGPWGLPEYFIISQTALPALLFLPGTQPIRFYVRVASFGISLALLAWWAIGNPRQTRPHPQPIGSRQRHARPVGQLQARHPPPLEQPERQLVRRPRGDVVRDREGVLKTVHGVSTVEFVT